MQKTVPGSIWQPTVTPLVNHQLPRPGANDTYRPFTKTSLISSEQERQIQNINREILQASQAHNTVPKPFNLGLNNNHQATMSTANQHNNNICGSGSNMNQQAQQVPMGRPTEHETVNNSTSIPPANLVHKQYNSPLDLYSMDNIRETLEAYSEVLSTGVKGINFLRPETPINTESEVYKLVKQEDQLAKSRQQQQQQQQRISPITGAPSTIGPLHHHPLHHIRQSSASPNRLPPEAVVSHQTPTSMSGPTSHYQTVTSTPRPSPISHVEPPTMMNSPPYNSAADSTTRPVCMGCGHLIVGPFVRIQNNRSLHADCFKCTTCGSGLKNVGHFTINEKLYCDIHARQVQNMLQQQQRNRNLVMQQQEMQNIRESPSPRPHFSGNQAANLQKQGGTRPPLVATKPFEDSFVPQTNRQQQDQQYWASKTSSLKQQLRENASSNANYNDSLYRAAEPKPYKAPTSFAAKPSAVQQPKISATRRFEESTISSSSTSQEYSISTNRGLFPGPSVGASSAIPTIGRGQLQNVPISGDRIPLCHFCHVEIHGPYVLAGRSTWCKQCSQHHFNCSSCQRSLLDIGFVEDSQNNRYFCEQCFEAYHAPICARCNMRIKGDCLKALDKHWHPSCFVCGHCKRPFGNSSFYLEDGVPYCERDWNRLFTTKCVSCSYPIEAGDKWIEALNQNYHARCFKCTFCHVNLEGTGFYCKDDKPYCRLNAH